MFPLLGGIVAAFIKRITPDYPPNRFCRTLNYPVFAYCLNCILGTSWVKTARRREKRRNNFLIPFYKENKNFPHLNAFHDIIQII